MTKKPTVSRGDAMTYRAIAGDFYDAKVVSVRPDGLIDINVQCSPRRPDDILFLSRITVAEKTRGAAWPKPKQKR